MSRIDDIIKKIPEYDEEPLEGHSARFEARLSARSRKIHTYSQVLKIAAVFVLVILSASLIYYLKDQKKQSGLASAQNEELKEAGIYYTNLLNSELSDLEIMAKKGIGSENEIMSVKKELFEMDHQFQDIRKDYKLNPNDERVQGAMIEYYQAKLDIVNTIKSDWENAQQLKNKYDENPKS